MSLVALIKCPPVPIPKHLSALGCRHGTLYGNMQLSANSTHILLIVSPRLLSLLLIFVYAIVYTLSPRDVCNLES